MVRTGCASWTSLAAAAVLCALAGAAGAAGGGMSIVLSAGAGEAPAVADGKPVSAPVDMQLDFTVRGGQVDKEVWGFAAWFNRAQHRGVATGGELGDKAAKITVRLAVADDATAPGGEAQYVLDLARDGDRFSGTYSGTFLGKPVRGAAAGTLSAGVVQPVSGFAAPQTGEHPRLIFRKGDLPMLKARAQTPEGKAMTAMLTSAPLREAAQMDEPRRSWAAVNAGVLYHLAGDARGPERARGILLEHVVRKPLPAETPDANLAPRLVGLALAYDLCRDAWDAEFRGQVAAYLRTTMNDLARGVQEGVVMEGMNPAPWSGRNAMRMAAVGLAAMALADEKDASGKAIAEAAGLADLAERSVLHYLRAGVGESGAGSEYPAARNRALACGVLQFLHANRVARGRDLSAACRMLLAGRVIEASAQPMSDGLDLGVSSLSGDQGGLWPMGIATVPADLLGCMKWCLDRDAGLAGRKTFDCVYPYHAAYALMNYPFDVPARAAETALPLSASDMVHGHHVFRGAWRDGNDFVTVVHLRSGWQRGVELGAPTAQGKRAPKEPPQATAAGLISIRGLGQELFAGVVGLPPQNRYFGGRTLRFESPRPGQYALSAALDAMYMKDVLATWRPPRREVTDTTYAVQTLRQRTNEEPEIDAELLKKPDVNRFLHAPGLYQDVKIRCKRYFAVDYTGASGRPALFVVLDRYEAPANTRWSFGGREVVWQRDRSFVLGEAAGVNLAGRIVSPGPPVRGPAPAADHHFLVFTAQRGAAPAMKVEGAGMETKVAIGEQTVSFDGERIVFGK
jgi:hypothetical protein